MATKEELLSRLRELHGIRDSLKSKIELQDEVTRLEKDVQRLEEEVAWREDAMITFPAWAELLPMMDDIIRESNEQFVRECMAKKKKLEDAVAEMAVEIEFLAGELRDDD